MANQELVKLLCAIAAFVCVGFGIRALFSGLKAEGVVDISALAKGKIRTGSAGVMLLFFGTILFAIVVFKGATSTKRETTDLAQPVNSITNADMVSQRTIREESGQRDHGVP